MHIQELPQGIPLDDYSMTSDPHILQKPRRASTPKPEPIEGPLKVSHGLHH